MRRHRGVSVALIVIGVVILFFAYSETALLTEVPNISGPSSTSLGNLYTSNVTLSKSTVLTVIGATGTFGLVPEQDVGSSLSGNLAQYSLSPLNFTGTSSFNLTYSGLSGKFVFVDYATGGNAPVLIESTNGFLASTSGLLVAISIVVIIGGIVLYPFGSRRSSLEVKSAVEEEGDEHHE